MPPLERRNGWTLAERAADGRRRVQAAATDKHKRKPATITNGSTHSK
jgi:hypothetical protein